MQVYFSPHWKIFFTELVVGLVVNTWKLKWKETLGFLILLTGGTRFDSDLCLGNLIPKCSLVENNPKWRGKKNAPKKLTIGKL